MASSTRILIAELDSPAQAARFARNSDARTPISELTGMLRIGTLVSDQVLITDAMLFDGEYFVRLGPEGVLRELGATQARFPITITGAHESLRQGLDARLGNPDFRWSLPSVDSAEVPRDVRHAWDEWLRYNDLGIVQYEQQEQIDTPLRAGAPPARTANELAELAALSLGDERYRSVAWTTIDTLEDEVRREKVRRWWNDAYLRMIAENARADWVTFESDDESPMELRADDTELPVSTELLTWARDASPATIALAGDASHRQRVRLHAKPSWARMRDLSFAVTQVAVVQTRHSVLIGSVAKIAIALVVVALALPGLQIGAIDSPWTWVAFAGAIATTVPFDALGALLRLLRRDPRTRLVLHRRATA